MWDGWRCLQEEAKERGSEEPHSEEKMYLPFKRDLKVGYGHFVYKLHRGLGHLMLEEPIHWRRP